MEAIKLSTRHIVVMVSFLVVSDHGHVGIGVLYETGEHLNPIATLNELAMETERPDHAGVVFHPPVLLLAAIVMGFAARWFVPLAFLPVAISEAAGPIMSGVSLVPFFWAVYSMRRGGASIPTGEPTENIVLSGPYRFSRNPIYLAMLLLQIGISFWANSLWFLLAAALFAVLLVWGVILREERYLERKFGADYVAYKTQVRRWL